jgi:hypothetical protein
MQKGDISNQSAKILVFDLENVIVQKKFGWFDSLMLRWTNGYWILLSNTHAPAPGVVRTCNQLIAGELGVYIVLVGAKWSKYIARKVLEHFAIPFSQFENIDTIDNLRDYLIDVNAAAFYSSDIRKQVKAGNKLSIPFHSWSELVLPTPA